MWRRASVRWWERPLDATFVLDELGEREEIGVTGAAGFSIGGYTAAALLGAQPARLGGERDVLRHLTRPRE